MMFNTFYLNVFILKIADQTDQCRHTRAKLKLLESGAAICGGDFSIVHIVLLAPRPDKNAKLSNISFEKLHQ